MPSIASASPLLPRRVITQPSAGTPTDTGRLADSAIGALRTHHEDLATRVRGFDDDDLGRRSGASGWQVAQVLGHLGSGAEITLAVLQAAVSGAERPGRDFNAAVWDRWNAMTPREQAEGFLVANQALGSAFENLNGTARRDIRIDLGFLPFPADLALFSGMRFNEAALHGWGVRVASDDDAVLPASEAATALELLTGPLGFLLGLRRKRTCWRDARSRCEWSPRTRTGCSAWFSGPRPNSVRTPMTPMAF